MTDPINNPRHSDFNKLVLTKFNIFNGLFINLPYEQERNVGVLIPLLTSAAVEGLKNGMHPEQILNEFFEEQSRFTDEKSQIDFMFRVIQYVERQVVLYDSVEDAAFPELNAHSQSLGTKDYVQLAKKEGKWEELKEHFSRFSARIIFTAHPTQFYPPAVLDIISRLRELVKQNALTEIDDTLQQLGLTSLLNKDKPTPMDEAKNIIYYLRNVYYHAVGELYGRLKVDLDGSGFDNHGIFRLGFWPGGDRDGNPFVTAEVTAEVADELRMTLMKCYYNDIKLLQKKLTFRGVDSLLAHLRFSLYDAMFQPEMFLSFEDIESPLLTMRELLIDQYHSLYLEDLDAFIDKVRIFRTHFAILDIRQDHHAHVQVMTFVLKSAGRIKESLDELGEGELLDICLNAEINVSGLESDDPLILDTLKNISQLEGIQAKNGEQGCNRYVISNSEDIYSVLFVYALFRWCMGKKEVYPFDIVPLFETMKGMAESEAIMKTLFSIPAYKKHVEDRGQVQTMMLGFSDGTKDGGYLKANWSIYKTKENLTRVCKENGVKAIFFDGRGGPPARGGGKTHRFYAAQSNLIANNEIQLTIQGQTITSTYGTNDQFKYNCRQLLGAGLSNALYGERNIISDAQRALIERLSELSFQTYSELKEHPMFIPYLENKSTLKYYGRANIGSRPGKRGGAKKLTLSDLRAISFVGSWSQLKQNVPGYFGIGSALKVLIDEGRLVELKALFQEVALFRALVLNSMMSLKKTNFNLTAYMANDPEYGPFWNILKAEYERSKELLLLISGYDILMEQEAISRMSVEVREHIVLPLLVIQQYALQQVSKNPENKAIYETMVTRSLYGNINASRNSA